MNAWEEGSDIYGTSYSDISASHLLGFGHLDIDGGRKIQVEEVGKAEKPGRYIGTFKLLSKKSKSGSRRPRPASAPQRGVEGSERHLEEDYPALLRNGQFSSKDDMADALSDVSIKVGLEPYVEASQDGSSIARRHQDTLQSKKRKKKPTASKSDNAFIGPGDYEMQSEISQQIPPALYPASRSLGSSNRSVEARSRSSPASPAMTGGSSPTGTNSDWQSRGKASESQQSRHSPSHTTRSAKATTHSKSSSLPEHQQSPPSRKNLGQMTLGSFPHQSQTAKSPGPMSRSQSPPDLPARFEELSRSPTSPFPSQRGRERTLLSPGQASRHERGRGGPSSRHGAGNEADMQDEESSCPGPHRKRTSSLKRTPSKAELQQLKKQASRPHSNGLESDHSDEAPPLDLDSDGSPAPVGWHNNDIASDFSVPLPMSSATTVPTPSQSPPSRQGAMGKSSNPIEKPLQSWQSSKSSKLFPNQVELGREPSPAATTVLRSQEVPPPQQQSQSIRSNHGKTHHSQPHESLPDASGTGARAGRTLEASVPRSTALVGKSNDMSNNSLLHTRELPGSKNPQVASARPQTQGPLSSGPGSRTLSNSAQGSQLAPSARSLGAGRPATNSPNPATSRSMGQNLVTNNTHDSRAPSSRGISNQQRSLGQAPSQEVLRDDSTTSNTDVEVHQKKRDASIKRPPSNEALEALKETLPVTMGSVPQSSKQVASTRSRGAGVPTTRSKLLPEAYPSKPPDQDLESEVSMPVQYKWSPSIKRAPTRAELGAMSREEEDVESSSELWASAPDKKKTSPPRVASKASSKIRTEVPAQEAESEVSMPVQHKRSESIKRPPSRSEVAALSKEEESEVSVPVQYKRSESIKRALSSAELAALSKAPMEEEEESSVLPVQYKRSESIKRGLSSAELAALSKARMEEEESSVPPVQYKRSESIKRAPSSAEMAALSKAHQQEENFDESEISVPVHSKRSQSLKRGPSHAELAALLQAQGPAENFDESEISMPVQSKRSQSLKRGLSHAELAALSQARAQEENFDESEISMPVQSKRSQSLKRGPSHAELAALSQAHRQDENFDESEISMPVQSKRSQSLKRGPSHTELAALSQAPVQDENFDESEISMPVQSKRSQSLKRGPSHAELAALSQARVQDENFDESEVSMPVQSKRSQSLKRGPSHAELAALSQARMQEDNLDESEISMPVQSKRSQSLKRGPSHAELAALSQAHAPGEYFDESEISMPVQSKRSQSLKRGPSHAELAALSRAKDIDPESDSECSAPANPMTTLSAKHAPGSTLASVSVLKSSTKKVPTQVSMVKLTDANPGVVTMASVKAPTESPSSSRVVKSFAAATPKDRTLQTISAKVSRQQATKTGLSSVPVTPEVRTLGQHPSDATAKVALAGSIWKRIPVGGPADSGKSFSEQLQSPTQGEEASNPAPLPGVVFQPRKKLVARRSSVGTGAGSNSDRSPLHGEDSEASHPLQVSKGDIDGSKSKTVSFRDNVSVPSQAEHVEHSISRRPTAFVPSQAAASHDSKLLPQQPHSTSSLSYPVPAGPAQSLGGPQPSSKSPKNHSKNPTSSSHVEPGQAGHTCRLPPRSQPNHPDASDSVLAKMVIGNAITKAATPRENNEDGDAKSPNSKRSKQNSPTKQASTHPGIVTNDGPKKSKNSPDKISRSLANAADATSEASTPKRAHATTSPLLIGTSQSTLANAAVPSRSRSLGDSSPLEHIQRCANCRFTRPDGLQFVGIDGNDLHLNNDANVSTCRMQELQGDRRRSCVDLLQAVDNVLETVRGAAVSTLSGLHDLPGLLSQLNNEFVSKASPLLLLGDDGTNKPQDYVRSIDGVPVALPMLVRLVETLDTIVAADDEDCTTTPSEAIALSSFGAGCGRVGSWVGGDARRSMCPDTLISILDSLWGPRGYLQLCLGLLQSRGSKPAAERCEWEQNLVLHATLALRLTLACRGPPKALRQTAAQATLAQNGLQSLMLVLKTRTFELKNADFSDFWPQSMGEMALVLESLRLLVPQIDVYQWSPAEEIVLVANLAPMAASALASLASSSLASSSSAAADHQHPHPSNAASGKSVVGSAASIPAGEPRLSTARSSAAAAAVSLLAAISESPAVAATIVSSSSDDAWAAQTAKALLRYLQREPLTLRLAIALQSLPTKRRKQRGISTMLGSGDSAKEFSTLLREALAKAEVPKECIHSAARALTSHERWSPTSAKSMVDWAWITQERSVRDACLYESVEAFAVNVHGSSVASKLMQELQMLAPNDESIDSLASAGRSSAASGTSGRQRFSLKNALQRLQRDVIARLGGAGQGNPSF